MWLFIEPLDVLLFRESKPFTAGESFWVQSAFPPSPLPFLGAIRSKVLVENHVDFKAYTAAVEAMAQGKPVNDPHLKTLLHRIGGPDDCGRIQVTGPFLCQREGKEVMPYFALPFDLLVRKDQTTTRLRPHPLPWPDLYAIPPALKTLWTNEEGEVAKDRLLNATNLKAYLGDSPAVSTPQHALWDSETRVGIELSGRRTAEEGKLYTVEFTRLKGAAQVPVGFLVQVTGLEGTWFPASGLLTLGGESHGAKYEKLEDNDLARDFKEMVSGDKLKGKLQNKPGFKLYLATPALFQNGWVPDFLSAAGGAYRGRVGSVELKLVAAAVGKAVSIGGWDLVRKKPRSMRKAVPAGSVYFFEKANGQLEDQDIETLFHAFHFKSLLCQDWSQVAGVGEPPLAEEGKAGFGLALLGVWLKEEAHV